MSTEDKAPGIQSTGVETAPLPGMPPPPPPEQDSAPKKRPTTRAARAAQSAAKKAAATGKADSRPKSAKATPRRATLETRLTGSLTTLGTLVAITGSTVSDSVVADGALIVQHAPNVAAALDKVAKDDPRVAAALEKMLTAGVWSGLIAAMLPLAVGIAANHGAIPAHIAEFIGAVPEPAQAQPEPTSGPGGVGIV